MRPPSAAVVNRNGTGPPGAADAAPRRRKHSVRKWLALVVAIALLASACSSAASSAAAATKLTIAAVQGVEDAGLKALAPMYTAQTGVKIDIVEAPYADLYTKLVNTFRRTTRRMTSS